MTAGSSTTLFLLGRLVLGGYFLYNGANHFLGTEMLAGYAASKGVPMPTVAVIGSGVLLFVGGVTFLTGIRPRLGAAALAVFLLAVSPIMHAFWAIDDPQARMMEMVNFTKNMALLGAVFITASVPRPWPKSLAGSVERPERRTQVASQRHAEQGH